MSLLFEWDERKAVSNAAKHGVTFVEAATVFADPMSLTIHDTAHSHDEDRFVTLGMSTEGQIMVVVHTDRDDNIRIISARIATRRERNTYEQA